MKALLVIFALGFALAMMISLPPGITANQAAAQNAINTINTSSNAVNATLSRAATEIDCSLPPTVSQQTSSSSGYYLSTGGQSSGDYSGLTFTDMNESHYSAINSISGVATVIPILQANEQDGQFAYQIQGIPTDASLINTYPIAPYSTNMTSGRTLQAGDSGVAVIGQTDADHWGVAVGGTINILGKNFEVVGIHGYSVATDESNIYMSLSDAQAITGNSGNATTLKVFCNNVNDVSSVQAQIQSSYSELDVNSATSLLSQVTGAEAQTAQELKQAQNTMNQTQGTAITEIAVAIVAASSIVLFIMLNIVRERTKEIGTLKAMGASSRVIMGQFMIEGIVLSVIGGVLGIAIGVVGATALAGALLPHVNQAAGFMTSSGSTSSTALSVSVSPELMLIGLGAAVLLGALGTLYPAWRASRTRPAEAMRYE